MRALRTETRHPRTPLLMTAGLLLFCALATGQPKPIRIACIGPASSCAPPSTGTLKDSPPAQLQRMLGDRYEVRAFPTNNGYQDPLRFLPDIALVDFAGNEMPPGSSEALEKTGQDHNAVVASFLRLPSHPRVILLIPPFVSPIDTADPSRPRRDSLALSGLQQLAYSSGCEIINLRTHFLGLDRLFSTGRVLSCEGSRVLAYRLKEAVHLGDAPPFDILAAAHIDGLHSSYFGFDCCDFAFEERSAKIVRPKRTAPGHPWIWRARFWGHEPQTEIALLERGFHLVYCDVAELFGNERALRIWDRFYSMLTQSGLSARAALEGFSRGGIYIYRWAAFHPERVACIYADAPVLDFKSWPGGKGRSSGNPAEWERFKQDFDLASEEEALAFKGSPIDLVREIAQAGFPMLHVCGDSDKTVPVEENTDIFEQKILALGGHITVIRKPGIGHHPHSLPNPQPIVDFILNAVGKP